MKKILFLLSFAITSIVYSQTTPTLKQVANAGNVAWKPLFYNANYGAQATDRWLTDKRYVDSSDAVVSAAGWKITGNVLGADTRFLGSTDNFDVLFKTNNIERGRFLKTGELRLGLASTVNASLILNNSTNANTLTINSGVTSASYALTLPTAQGGASTVLQNNGAGVLSWSSPSAMAWMLAGNALTGAEHTPTEFFGSTNDFDVVFRENNTEVFRLYNGFMGIGQSVPTAKLFVKGIGTTSVTFGQKTTTSADAISFSIRDDQQISGVNLALGAVDGTQAKTPYGLTLVGTSSTESIRGYAAVGGTQLYSITPTATTSLFQLFQSGASTVQFNSANLGTNYILNNGGLDIGVFAAGPTPLGDNGCQLRLNELSGISGDSDILTFYRAAAKTMGLGNNNVAAKVFVHGYEANGSLEFGVASNVNSLTINGTGSVVLDDRLLQIQGADVASAAGPITLGGDGNTFEITGTNVITLISNLGWQNGSEVNLIFTSTATLTNGTATSGTDITLILAGAANFVASSNDVIKLVLSEMGGTQAWREVSRSVN